MRLFDQSAPESLSHSNSNTMMTIEEEDRQSVKVKAIDELMRLADEIGDNALVVSGKYLRIDCQYITRTLRS